MRRDFSPRHGAGVLLTLLLFGATVGFGPASLSAQQEQFNLNIHRRVSGLTSSGPPEVIDGHVLLTFDGETDVRYVAAAFAHEDFARLHTFNLVRNTVQNPDDPNDTATARVFALAYPIPEDAEQLEYRIIVDGLWRTDPTNPQTVRDPNGVTLSVFELPERPPASIETPRIGDGGRVEFIFAPDPGAGLQSIGGQIFDLPDVRGLSVYVAGDFNNWDPFMHRLRETEPGVYRLSIPVSPGRHHYYLVVEGRRVLDPRNAERTRHADGFRVCSFTVP
ncbi:MAG: hypothetical protein R6W94_14020 [Spirochaetia bacterium]